MIGTVPDQMLGDLDSIRPADEIEERRSVLDGGTSTRSLSVTIRRVLMALAPGPRPIIRPVCPEGDDFSG
jgi:hypothetical protein